MAEPIPFRTAFHADWSTAAKKCWVAKAERTDEGWYVCVPHPVGNIGAFVDGLFVAPGPVLAGFDFPIGLPDAYGRLTKLESFPAALHLFGQGVWAEFFMVAETPKQVTLTRPFYPRMPLKGIKRDSLVQGLGLQYDKLLRECERPTPIRGAACCLFWTLGGSQVGRAAISGWQEVVAPARRRGAKLWPFEGSLAELARAGYPVIAETYPAEAYSHVGIRFPRNGSKRRQHDRAFATKGIFEWASRNQVTFCELLVNQIEMGFGPHEDGEDPFDALAGILSMIEVLDGRRSEGPENGSAHVWEGWILGQPSVSTIHNDPSNQPPAFGMTVAITSPTPPSGNKRIAAANVKLLRIKKAALEALSHDELALFIGGGKVLNEMNIGTKQLWFAMNSVTASPNSVQRSAAFAMLGYSLRVLAGHIYEARQFLTMKPLLGKNETAQATYFDTTFVKNRKEVISYFGRENIIQQIRQKFSFHTDTKLLLRAFDSVGSNFEYDLLLSDKYSGHHLFYGSEAIMFDGVQHLKAGASWDEAINALFEETIHIASVVSSVLQRLLGFILNYRLGITALDVTSFEIADGPVITEVVVPFFCMPPERFDLAIEANDEPL